MSLTFHTAYKKAFEFESQVCKGELRGAMEKLVEGVGSFENIRRVILLEVFAYSKDQELQPGALVDVHDLYVKFC